MKFSIFIFLFFSFESAIAFVLNPKHSRVIAGKKLRNSSSQLSSIGGPKWNNDNFLDSLGDKDDDNSDQQEQYQEFKETREAFMQRQQERMNNSPAAQDFMSRQQGATTSSWDPNDDDDSEQQDLNTNEPSRFSNMMKQAAASGRRGQRPPGFEWMRGPPGLQQKLAIPLDDDDDEDQEEE